MSVRRKLFVAMASLIAAMSALFALTTQFVVSGVVRSSLATDRSAETASIAASLLSYYDANGGRWSGLARSAVPAAADAALRREEAGFVLLSPEGERLLAVGSAEADRMVGLGVREQLERGDGTVGLLYYYDAEVANAAKLRHGVIGSVTFLLFAGGAVAALFALAAAYFVAGRLTAPLHALVAAIRKVEGGELDARVPIHTKDEYGAVARAFNAMSSRLARTERARRQLTADVAHELRTPITIVRGQLEWLQQEGKPIEPERLLPLQDELIRLSRLTDDIRQLSLAEAGALPLEKRPMDIADWLARCVERVSAEAEAKRIAVRLRVEPGLPPIEADAHRLTQVLLNLLTNAVRYVPEGGAVDVSAAAETEARDGGSRYGARLLTVRVADDGPGVEAEQLERLFDRFYRTDEARSRHRGGSGLGLAIAKGLVELHGGTIAADSRPGEGTTFTVRLPYSPE